MGLVEIATSTLFVSLVAFIAGLSLFTIYLLYRNYQETKLTDYSILLFFYVTAIVNTSTNALYQNRDPDTNNILEWHGRALLVISAIINWYLIYLHGSRLLWKEEPKKLKYLMYILFFIMSISGLVKVADLDWYENNLLYFDIYVSNILRVITGFVLIYAYLQFQAIDKGKHVTWTRFAYGTIGLVQFAIGAINLLIKIILDVTSYTNDELSSLVTTQSLVPLLAIFGFIAAFIVTINYPESILISEAQVSRINQYYQKVIKRQNVEEDTSPQYWKYDRLQDYIANLPKDLFEDTKGKIKIQS